MTPVSVTASKSHNDTAVVDAPKEAVFGYLAQIENLPEWATEFAPELKDDQGDAMQQGSGPRCCTGPGPCQAVHRAGDTIGHGHRDAPARRLRTRRR